MTTPLAVLISSTACGLLAVILIAMPPADPSTSRRSVDPNSARTAAIAVASALVVLALTGWLAPALVAGAAAHVAARAWMRRDRRQVDEIERIDALASWIENLRDVLIAGDQPIGAITATVSTCPAPIRPPVRRLAAGLGRQDPGIVFRRFADELDDPLGDLVAAGLLIAVERGARTVGVLTSLATQARQQADRRRLVEAERAPVQREVVVLTVVMGSLLVGLFVIARSEYLEPYDTASGQLFLGAVLAIYLVLLARVQRLARYPRPHRFLVTDQVMR